MLNPISEQQKNLLLIDADPVFASLLTAQAKEWEVDVDAYQSFFEIEPNDDFDTYNLAIVDCSVGNNTLAEIRKNIEKFCKNTPVVLVSDNDEIADAAMWSDSIVGVIPKANGCTEILEEAMKNVRIARQGLYELSDTDAWQQQLISQEEFDSHTRWWVL